MLTLVEIDELDALAYDLAKRGFGGLGKVGQTDHGVVRLTLVRQAVGRAVWYRVLDFSGLTYEVAAHEILAAVAAVSA